MKFFTLVALVGYTTAIRLAGPTGTVHVDGTFDPIVAPVAPAAAAPEVVNEHPGTHLSPYVDPSAATALAQGPSGTIHQETTFDPPATPATPAAPATTALAQVQGPNGTVHIDGTFDPIVAPVAPAAEAPEVVNEHPGTHLSPYVDPNNQV